MATLAPFPPDKALARLERPQRLGFLPTLAFWKRRDVWKIAGPWTAAFVFLWTVLLDLFVRGLIPAWASPVIAGAGPVLFVGLLERYLRARLGRRRVPVQARPPRDSGPARLHRGAPLADPRLGDRAVGRAHEAGHRAGSGESLRDNAVARVVDEARGAAIEERRSRIRPM